MSRRPLAILVVLAGLVAFLSLRQRLRPLPSNQESPFHALSASLIASTGRPQLLEFFHKA